MAYIDDGFDNSRDDATSTGVGLSVGGLVDNVGSGPGNPHNNSNVGHTCGIGTRNVGGPFEQLQQSSDSPHAHYHNQSIHQQQQQQTTPTNVIPLGPMDRMMVRRQDSNMFYSSAAPSLPFSEPIIEETLKAFIRGQFKENPRFQGEQIQHISLILMELWRL